MPSPAFAFPNLEFSEAIAYFRARVPMTDEEFAGLVGRARERAFTISGVSQLSIVTEVWEALDASLAQGETFADFKARVGEKLATSWGTSAEGAAPRMERIYRNAMQNAYSAGRYQQATSPVVRKARPVWRFSAIQDKNTSPLCSAANGTTLAADDPWWETHYPPCHHFCRSTVITLRASQAEALGGLSESAPDIDAGDGFGGFPTPVNDYKPDPAAYPAALWKVYSDKPAAAESDAALSSYPPVP